MVNYTFFPYYVFSLKLQLKNEALTSYSHTISFMESVCLIPNKLFIVSNFQLLKERRVAIAQKLLKNFQGKYQIQ